MSGRGVSGCAGGGDDGGGGDVEVGAAVGGDEGWVACHSHRSPGSMGDPGGCTHGGSHVVAVLEVGTWRWGGRVTRWGGVGTEGGGREGGRDGSSGARSRDGEIRVKGRGRDGDGGTGGRTWSTRWTWSVNC